MPRKAYYAVGKYRDRKKYGGNGARGSAVVPMGQHPPKLRRCLKCGDEFTSVGDRLCGDCNLSNLSAGKLESRTSGRGRRVFRMEFE